MDAICSGPHDFTFKRHGCPDIIPTANLWNREHVTIAQGDIILSYTGHRFSDIYFLLFSNALHTVLFQVPRQVGSLAVCASFQATRQTHQFRSSHALTQRILAGPSHFSLDRNGLWICFCQIAVDKYPVFRLEQNIVCLITGKRFR